ncbi:MAG: CRISPR-associated endonuclease Cas1 [Pyrinomonadaceae bacterium]|jgi:CRISPR-associated protein Cas1|nr:CRISPR-associated endonuclease Cas1 [Pyrinomonadaceae bacterium]
MSTIYVTTQGANVQRRSGQIIIGKGKDILQNVPESQIKQMILVGNINLSTPFVSFCLEKDIEVVYLTQGGKFRGRLVGNGRKNAEIRVRQYDLARDTSFRLRQVKAIVAGKIQNQIDVAIRQNETNSREVSTLKKMFEKTSLATTTESLLGIEGAASATYFTMFRRWIPQPFVFDKRTSNPPKNEVNVLLSLSYTLIYNRLESLINLAGLDAYQGFFHAPKDGHASLASDLTEEFRSVFCDSIVLKLIRRKQINLTHFEKSDGKFLLSKEGSKIFFGEFEAKMASQRQTEKGESLSFREIMKRQVYQLARVIKGEEKVYKPFRLR